MVKIALVIFLRWGKSNGNTRMLVSGKEEMNYQEWQRSLNFPYTCNFEGNIVIK